MSSIITNSDFIIICANDKILVFNKTTNKSTELNLPALEIPPNLSKNQQDALKNEKSTILSTAFSKCGKYFAVCTLNKQLVVFNNNFKVIKNLTVARGVSKIRFTSSCDIVVADKTGDVYLYRLQSDNNEAEQLLGHLSMLLDVIVSDNEKYIVTCDRDEKIRVSCYPGSYNIISFCLGHEEFVLNLEFLNSDVLISSSGDGTIRFWDYVFGKQLKIINTNDYIKDKSLIEKFCQFMDSETVEIISLPVTSMKLIKFLNKTLIVASLINFKGLQVYEINEINLDIKLLQIIDVNITCFDTSDDNLYVLTDSGIKIYQFTDKFSLITNSNIDAFYNSYNNLIKNVVNDNISVLYKRKYDNVQEYQERKKLRIENKK